MAKGKKRVAEKKVYVFQYTGGLVGPSLPMLGPVADGGTIVAATAPGCWGPMITPKFKGGHEVTQPVAVAGAEVGDAIAISIQKVKVTSLATASGTHSFVEGRYIGDPFVARKCPKCGVMNPSTKLVGIGQEAVRCAQCGEEISPFRVHLGYTMVFDHKKGVAVTVSKGIAKKLAKKAVTMAALPSSSEQHPILAFDLSDMPGIVTRLRPFLGNIGTTPAIDMPDSHNCGDFGQFLVDAPHEYRLTKEQLKLRTDGHLDIDSVREGAVLICPVKVRGGGVYMGDMHAQQGDGEIAVHTTDVSGEATVKVQVIKGLGIEGPILLPPTEDLPYLARPLRRAEKNAARALAQHFGQAFLEEALPIQVIGSGANLNEAAECGLERAARFLEMSLDEVKNRVTITGAVEIGRLPGLVTVTLMAPLKKLEKREIADIVRKQYRLSRLKN
ncbi:MAG: acetamidase/formamidase family protein [candidate division NC10 bacterium]|nr:acetamidase/formamidase family protein [candidate division NC10 bacterium]